MLTLEALQQRLEALIGAGRVQSEAAFTTAYVLGSQAPRLVVQPQTAAQVAAVLACADEERLAVVPWGQGTQMHVGSLPTRYDLALSLAGLRRVVEYDTENLTLTAEAGLPLRQVYTLTIPQRQFLALGHPGSTQSLGGVLVTNTSGVKRLRYGAIRDLLLGIRVALPEGAVVHFGGRVVKNVAGYDMNKLFLGSLGTFGVVVEATYRLAALPQDDRILVLAFPSLTHALQAVKTLRTATLLPSALTMLAAETVHTLPGIVPLDVRAPQVLVCLNYDGTYEAVERQIRDSREASQPHGLVADSVLTGAPLLTFWEQVETWRTMASANTALLSVRCGVPPARLGEALALVTTPPAFYPQKVVWLADAGHGHIWAHAVVPEPWSETLLHSVHDWLQTLRAQVQALQGYVVVEQVPVPVGQHMERWGKPGGWQLLQRYKQQFDPHSMLNPGRYIAGL